MAVATQLPPDGRLPLGLSDETHGITQPAELVWMDPLGAGEMAYGGWGGAGVREVNRSEPTANPNPPPSTFQRFAAHRRPQPLSLARDFTIFGFRYHQS